MRFLSIFNFELTKTTKKNILFAPVDKIAATVLLVCSVTEIAARIFFKVKFGLKVKRIR